MDRSTVPLDLRIRGSVREDVRAQLAEVAGVRQHGDTPQIGDQLRRQAVEMRLSRFLSPKGRDGEGKETFSVINSINGLNLVHHLVDHPNDWHAEPFEKILKRANEILLPIGGHCGFYAQYTTHAGEEISTVQRNALVEAIVSSGLELRKHD